MRRVRAAARAARRALAVATVGAIIFCASRAGAIELKLLGQPLRIDITESFFSSYHGDLGGLVVEHDAPMGGMPGTAHPEAKFVDILNRLNVVLAWKRFRLAARFDTAAYPYVGFDYGTIGHTGPCQDPASEPAVIRSKFCGTTNGDWPRALYFWPEKLALEYNGRSVELTVGDFYISLGRGLVLSIRKLDELGIDTTLLGARFQLHEGPVGATLALGVTNIQNVDEATGRFAPDPFDVIAAGRVEYRFLDRVLVGLHEVGGIQHLASVPNNRKLPADATLMYGGTIDAPRLLPWLGLYFEGAGQMMQRSGTRSTGYALYGALTGYAGPVSILLEVKHYVHYQQWRASVDSAFPEFAPVIYNQPPTAERVQTELVAPINDVSGPRLRVDWRVNPWLLVYASYAYFEDRGEESGTLLFHDPYAGAELRWNGGASHFFPSGGYRIERCGPDAALCRATSPDDEFQHVGHVEWDGTQALPHRLSIETQGFALFRRGDKVTAMDAGGNITYPSWTEGDAYLALKWTPYLVLTGGMEWTTRPNQHVNQYFFNGAVQWNITTASSIRVFVGGTRGGLKCISGICRDFPPFTGARLEVVVRL